MFLPVQTRRARVQFSLLVLGLSHSRFVRSGNAGGCTPAIPLEKLLSLTRLSTGAVYRSYNRRFGGRIYSDAHPDPTYSSAPQPRLGISSSRHHLVVAARACQPIASSSYLLARCANSVDTPRANWIAMGLYDSPNTEHPAFDSCTWFESVGFTKWDLIPGIRRFIQVRTGRRAAHNRTWTKADFAGASICRSGDNEPDNAGMVRRRFRSRAGRRQVRRTRHSRLPKESSSHACPSVRVARSSQRRYWN